MKLITPYYVNDYLMIDVFGKDIPFLETYRKKEIWEILSDTGLFVYDKEVKDIDFPHETHEIGSYKVVFPTHQVISFVSGNETTCSNDVRNKLDYKHLIEKLYNLNCNVVLINEESLNELSETPWKDLLNGRKIVTYQIGASEKWLTFNNDIVTEETDASSKLRLNEKIILSPRNFAAYDYENNMYMITVDLNELDWRRQDSLQFVDDVIQDLQTLLNYSEEKIIELRSEAEMKTLFKYVDQYIQKKKEEITDEIAEFRRERIEATAKAINRERRIIMNAGILSVLETITNKEYLEIQIDLIKRDNRIKHVVFQEKAVEFHTTYLYATDKVDNVYDIGKIKFTVNLETGYISFENLTHSDLYKTLPHSSGDTACWGSAEADVITAIAKFDLADIVELVLNWIESVNIDDQYGKYALDKWPMSKMEY